MTSSRTAEAATDEEQAEPTKREDADAAAEPTGETEASEAEAGGERDEVPEDEEAAATDDDESSGGVPAEPVETAPSDRSRLAAGAAAVAAAGLGLASLTGTWLGDLMASRQELIGQINSQTATPDEQLATIYGTPWHTTALFNGFFALAAILVAGAALVIPKVSKSGEVSPTWVRAVAFGGLALGTIGLVIAAVMWFDVFTELPTVPEPPAFPG